MEEIVHVGLVIDEWWSTSLDGCPQVWMAVHKFGWLSTSLDGCPQVWMAVHKFG